MLWNFGERRAKCAFVMEAFVENYVVDGKRKQRVGFAREIGDAVLNRGVYDGFAVEFVGNCFVVPLEEVLVDVKARPEAL